MACRPHTPEVINADLLELVNCNTETLTGDAANRSPVFITLKPMTLHSTRGPAPKIFDSEI